MATRFQDYVAFPAFSGNAAPGLSGSVSQLSGQKTGIADATATTIFTVTIPNISCGAGGRVLCSSTITEPSHVGDSTRTVEYVWSVTRLAGAVAVITISIVTGGTVIATKASGYTITSTLAATAVSGGATATNTFNIQVTNTGSTAAATAATWLAEMAQYGGSDVVGTAGTPAPGVTLAAAA